MRNRILCTTLCALAAITASARELPYGAVTDAALVRCDALHWGRNPAAASACYRALLGSSAPAVQAEAAWALGDLKSANALFRSASAARPGDAMLRVRWGELYIDTHQDQEALDLFKEALQREPNNAFARVDAARVLSNQFASEAGAYLQPVLDDERAAAGARLRALLLVTRMALEDSTLAAASQSLDQATALAQRAQLPLLEVYALRAGLELLSGRDGSAWSAMAIALDPAYGEAYATPAYFYVITRRQSEAVALYQQAVMAQPDLWSAQVELASCLLRENRISEAREHLELAYRGDPYDPVTTNTLRLLDSLSQFDVLVYGDPGSSMPSLILRMDKKESAVLAPYARALALRAMATYAQRYRFTLRSPVVVEIYPNHEDFAVRTAGMPGIGLLGVTFGYVLAMDSPSSRAVNEFHWGTTLWHELAHVYTLESTAHRVPRWLSEGLSVFEEWRTGPIQGMEIADYAYAALAQGKALPIAQLDRGFVHPAYPEQVQVSYMQAGLICDFIDRRFGFDKLRALLQAYVGTSDTEQAITQALGISAAEFDRRFAADLQQQYGTLFTQILPWQKARAAANAAAAREDWAQAQAQSQSALMWLAQDVDDGSPYLPLARAYGALGSSAQQQRTLEDYWRRGGHDPGALKQLAQQLHAAGRAEDAIAVLQSINYVAPFDDELHGILGDWLLTADRPADALAEYQVAFALKPPDLAAAHLRLARAHYALHALPDARREVLAALEVAPNYLEAQKLMLQLARATPSSLTPAH